MGSTYGHRSVCGTKGDSGDEKQGVRNILPNNSMESVLDLKRPQGYNPFSHATRNFAYDTIETIKVQESNIKLSYRLLKKFDELQYRQCKYTVPL